MSAYRRPTTHALILRGRSTMAVDRVRKLNFATKRQNETIEDKSIFCEGFFLLPLPHEPRSAVLLEVMTDFVSQWVLFKFLGATPSLSHAAHNEPGAQLERYDEL